MKNLLIIVCLLVAVVSGYAGNLVTNGELNKKLHPEYRNSGSTKYTQMTLFTEDGSWNKCVKLSIIKFYDLKNGKRKVNFGVIIGGDKKLAGFPVKPNTTYKYSFELKGSVPYASISAMSWSGECRYYKDRKRHKALGRVKVQPEWTVYKGTFKTGAEAKRGALYVQIWDQSNKAGKIATKLTDYLLVDKIVVEEQVANNGGAAQVAKLKATIVKKKAVVAEIANDPPAIDGKLNDSVWQNAQQLSGFVDYKTGKPVKADTQVKMVSDGQNIFIAVKCLEPEMAKLKASTTGNGKKSIWKDDVVEIFFSPDKNRVRQFVIGAGGGRWMGDGVKTLNKYDDWEAVVSKGDNYWIAEVRIPLELLGAKIKTELFDFNFCRERKPVKELSCWSPVRGNFHDKSRYGLLVIGKFENYLAKNATVLNRTLADLPESKRRTTALAELKKIIPAGKIDAKAFSSLYAKLEQLKQEAKFIKAGDRKFALAPVSPVADFSLPFNPDAVFNPPEKIAVKAAINEFRPLPLAIANMTDKPAAYRIFIYRGLDNGIEIPGLNGFDNNKITIRSAFAVADGDSKQHGNMYGPLPLINQGYTITVPAKQSGLLWITFDCRDVKAGSYDGKIRVIPLSDPGKFANKGSWKYTGAMQDIPLKLEVLPIELSREPAIPLWLMNRAENEKFFKSMVDNGDRIFQLSPWWFTFKFDGGGNIVGSQNLPKVEQVIKNHQKWAKIYKIKGLKFLIGFSGYVTFAKVHGKQFKYNSPAWRNAWQNWLKAIDKLMAKCDVKQQDYIMEVWDEPHLDKFDKMLNVSKLLKQAVPGMRNQVTFGATRHDVVNLKKLLPYVDVWCMWGTYFDDAEYLKFYETLRKSGDQLWFYYCSTNMRESLSRYYRRNAWIGYHYKTDNIGLFKFMSGGPGGYYGRSSWKRTAFGGIAYRSFDDSIPTIRGEAMNVGNMDIKYMQKLADLTTLAEKRKIAPALVAEAKQLLKTGPYKVVISQAHDETAADQVRNQAIELILKLQDKL